MDRNMSIDLGQVAHEVGLPVEKVQPTVDLLDQGNTVPFITRYRRDQTGGLDEEQIRRIQEHVTRLRMLADRKATILKSIESQGKLTPELADLINSAQSTKRLEDLYLPYKPKKQTLATIARLRGLEPLAREIYEAAPIADDLPARAAQFVNPDKQLHVLADVLQGVGHLISERFGERAELRGRLRKIVWRSGKLVSTQIESADKSADADKEQLEAEPEAVAAADDADGVQQEQQEQAPLATAETSPTVEADGSEAATVAAETVTENSADDAPDASSDASPHAADAATSNGDESAAPVVHEAALPPTDSAPADAVPLNAETPSAETTAAPAEPAPSKAALARRESKKRKKQKEESAYKDYYEYQEPLTHVPPHRILAINRGERARMLRVKIDVDDAAITREAEELLIAPDHPHAEFLRSCLRDALSRLVIPGLEREVRRELTDRAETHAVEVFAHNLRNLLLQPPVRNRRVLAIDPGFKSGCKLTALDEFGNVLAHGMLHVVGKEDRRKHGRAKLAEMIAEHNVSVVAIGNGTACREAEQLVADLISEELKDCDVAYVIVNEAGASVYSTSPLGREELPKYDAILRSAVSIGRRLLDPLSELVKINPANIGVGLYQHDIKAKHLRDSLDAVVESCVNYVGVDVNSASPALLRYVSGLNQLTARRLYEYRREHGPFRSREQFREVPGIGEASFVQAAGFLKIIGGENPLDTTWIHPESYAAAQQVLEKLDSSVSELVARTAPVEAPPAEQVLPQPAPEIAAPSESPTEVAASTDPITEAAAPTDSTTEATAPTDPPTEAAAAPAASAEPIAQSVSASSADAGSAAPDVKSSNGRKALAERVSSVDVDRLADELAIGKLLLQDILSALIRPGRDPRDDLPPPVFRRGILKLEDLKPGMELAGTVLNVVDFGAFVDIGLSDSGLVHISRLADRYVRDPHEVVGVGDVLKVWVVDVDKQRRRVSLTAIMPGSEKPPAPRREPTERRERKPPPQRQPKPQGAAQAPTTGQRTGGRPQANRGKPPKFQTQQRPERKPKPKPVTPITKEMEEGKAPLRSFSDLKQFFEKKKTDDEGATEK
jgi:uncharacterized protein